MYKEPTQLTFHSSLYPFCVYDLQTSFLISNALLIASSLFIYFIMWPLVNMVMSLQVP